MNEDKIASNLLAQMGLCELTDSELRSLRDKVFDRPSTNSNWEHVKANWAKPEALRWLKEEAEKVKL